MQKSNSYNNRVKSGKKTPNGEGNLEQQQKIAVPSGFTGIAGGSTQMMKNQSANLKPIPWGSTGYVMKTRNSAVSVENTDTMTDT